MWLSLSQSEQRSFFVQHFIFKIKSPGQYKRGLQLPKLGCAHARSPSPLRLPAAIRLINHTYGVLKLIKRANYNVQRHVSLEHATKGVLLLGPLRAQLHLELLELHTHLAALRVELGGRRQIGLRLVEVAHAQARLPAPEVCLERGGLKQQRRVARLDGGGEVGELEVALRGVEVARKLDLGRGGRVRRYLCLAPARDREIQGDTGRSREIRAAICASLLPPRASEISPYISVYLPACHRVHRRGPTPARR